MEYLLLAGKIYFTVWILFFAFILAFSLLPSNKGITKFWDKLFTITLAILLYVGVLLGLLTIFLKIWGII